MRFKVSIFFHSLSHFMVDFACFYAVYAFTIKRPNFALFILLYNFLAFALQAPFGALADKIQDTRFVTVSGIFLVSIGVLYFNIPWLSTVFLGVGNALFHVGGAVSILRKSPGSSKIAGFYVAPGALGTLFGSICGAVFVPSHYAVIGLLFICIICVIFTGPVCFADSIIHSQNESSDLSDISITLCLLSIGIRGLLGFVAKNPSDIEFAPFIASFSIFSGKLLGGVLSEKISANILTSITTLIGGVLITLCSNTVFVFVGLFLFNLAMPITLSAVMLNLNGHIGLGFGLTTLALFIGSSPLYLFDKALLQSYPIIGISLSIVSALILFFSLRKKKNKLA